VWLEEKLAARVLDLFRRIVDPPETASDLKFSLKD
jgi:hypothetical protein